MANDFFGMSSKVVFSSFLDRSKVIKQVDKKNRSAMLFIGGTTRKIARNSIRKSNSRTISSPPGSPVRTPTGIIKKTIFFEYDARKRVMICGPKKLAINSKVRSNKATPELLEDGGSGIATQDIFKRIKPRKKKGRRIKRKVVWVKIRKGAAMKYRPRPTMKLAKAKTFTVPKLRKAFGVIGFNTRT